MLETLLVAAGAAYASYRLFPEQLFRLGLRAQRHAARLRLKETVVDEHHVPYLEGGSGEPLLLLHGFGADKDSWALVSRYLTPHFRVIAPDVPGFGESSRRHDASYDLTHQLDRLQAFAANLGLTRFHLGGNSMGAYLAAMYAARTPAQISSLWLLAPAGVATAETSEYFAMIERGENVLLMESETIGKRVLSMIFCKPPYIPAQFERVWLRRAMSHATFNAKLFADLFGEIIPLDTHCRGLETRSLIVWGDDDRILHVSGAQGLHALLPNSQVRIMPAMGHCPMVERPRAAAADFLNFHRLAI